MLIKNMNIKLNAKEKRDLGIEGLKEYLTSKGKENVDDLFTEWEESGIGGGDRAWETVWTGSWFIGNNEGVNSTIDGSIVEQFCDPTVEKIKLYTSEGVDTLATNYILTKAYEYKNGETFQAMYSLNIVSIRNVTGIGTVLNTNTYTFLAIKNPSGTIKYYCICKAAKDNGSVITDDEFTITKIEILKC
jgi:hypothetical protein